MVIRTLRMVDDKSYPSMEEFVKDNLAALWDYYKKHLTAQEVLAWAKRQGSIKLSDALGRPVKFEE